MALTAGTRLGVYDVTAPIGAGGMGQVYRARDTTLGRQVAIKILPDGLAADPDRLLRFEREARTLAALNHPNIAAIHGFERSGTTHALIMELVEGEDLSQRIARGAVPLDEALPIARQIAEALEAAHEQGIIHRDLKPANIKVRADGAVKVLDFGLAKALDPATASGADAQSSPTITSPAMTAQGVILGTAAYMAPEQAKGKPVDRRADLWALGAVLYEMLTGQRAFKGEDTTETIVAVVSKEPDWTALPPLIPAPILRVLRRCLEKDRKRRLDSAAAVRLEIEDALTAPASEAATATFGPAAGARLPWALVATLAVVSSAGLFAWGPWRRAPVLLETRVDIVTPATNSPTSFALSPDGRRMVFAALGDGVSRLWLRELSTTEVRPLPGTEGATYPFWSPDGRSVGYFSADALTRLDLGGGAPRKLAPVSGGSGGTWSRAGAIVFAPNALGSLRRVSASGGSAVAVTTLGPQQNAHVAPHLLPDDSRFMFYARGAPDVAGIYLGGLDGRAATRLTAADGSGVYRPEDRTSLVVRAPSGWLLWVRAGVLQAQRLDVERGALIGEPATLADGVAVDGVLSAVSVATNGLVAYRRGAASQQQLTWVDRSGTARGTLGDPDGSLLDPRVSPDGRSVAVTRTVQGNADIWLLDGARTSRVTFDAAFDAAPLWAPDGTRIVFRSDRTGAGDLYQKLTSGAGAEERVVASDQFRFPTSWSADGRVLLYGSVDPQTDLDLWVVPMVGERTPSVFLRTAFRELWGTFSPDDRWVAYHSNESGRAEIYVRPFVPPGTTAGGAAGQWQVSTAGGIHPVWRPDGRELFYLNPDGAMMAAPVAVSGATLTAGAPVVLFPTRIYGGGVDGQQRRQYDVAPDGRFLINTVLRDAAAPITLVMNWNPEAGK